MSGLYKFFPTPSDKMGVLWALSAIRDAYIIEYGPGGTTHFSMEGIFKMNGEFLAHTYTTHIDEDDVVMGDTGKLRRTILEVDEVYHPSYIFVIASSLVSVIGSDIRGVVHELGEQVKARLIVYQSGGFKGDYTAGVRQALHDLAAKVVQPCAAKDPLAYNLIGCCVDDYRYAADAKAIRQVLQDALGIRCACVFTAGCSMDEIEKASQASLNIVLRHEGVDCAETLRQRFDIPFISAHPIGYQATITLIEEAAGALNLAPDAAYMAAARERARSRIMQVKGHFRKAANRCAVISGGLDAACGYRRFLADELGFTVSAALVHHVKPEGQALQHYQFGAKEDEKEAAILAAKPALVLGDAVLLHYADPGCFRLQTQNPNLEQVLITTHKPRMCFDGADDIIEKLLNYHVR